MRMLSVMVLLGLMWLGVATHVLAAPAPPGGVSAPMPPFTSSTMGAEVLILSVTVGIPYASLNLVPVIGNLVVLPGRRSRKTRVGWGITGIVMGGIGLMGGLSLTAYSASIGAPEMIPFTLPLTVVGATSLALGFANLFKRNRRIGMAKRSGAGAALAADTTLYKADFVESIH